MLDDLSVNALQSALDGLSARQQAISDDIANVNTPYYKARSVAFESSLKQALANGDNPLTASSSVNFSNAAGGLNGNNVNLAEETVAGAKTEMSYELALRAVSDRFSLTRTAIKGGLSRMFESLNISGTGMTTHQTWMDAISDNIANVNTVRSTSESAFQARYVQAQAQEGGLVGTGVAVAGIQLGSAEGILTFDPDNPMADGNGMVRRPDIDLGEQMTDMIMAQRGYQANIANLDRVRSAYQAAIQMGRG